LKQFLFLFIFASIIPAICINAGTKAEYKEMQVYLERQKELAYERGPVSDNPPRGNESITQDPVLDNLDFRNAHLALLKARKEFRETRTPYNKYRVNAAWSLVVDPKLKAEEEVSRARKTIKKLKKQLDPLERYFMTGQKGEWVGLKWVASPIPPTKDESRQMLAQRIQIKAQLQQASEEAALAESKFNQAERAIRQGEWQAKQDEFNASLREEAVITQADYASRVYQSGTNDQSYREFLKAKVELGRWAQPSEAAKLFDWIEDTKSRVYSPPPEL
jgi:hypothetical protein